MGGEHGDADASYAIFFAFIVRITWYSEIDFLKTLYMATIFACARGAYCVGAISAIFEVWFW